MTDTEAIARKAQKHCYMCYRTREEVINEMGSDSGFYSGRPCYKCGIDYMSHYPTDSVVVNYEGNIGLTFKTGKKEFTLDWYYSLYEIQGILAKGMILTKDTVFPSVSEKKMANNANKYIAKVQLPLKKIKRRIIVELKRQLVLGKLTDTDYFKNTPDNVLSTIAEYL